MSQHSPLTDTNFYRQHLGAPQTLGAPGVGPPSLICCDAAAYMAVECYFTVYIVKISHIHGYFVASFPQFNETGYVYSLRLQRVPKCPSIYGYNRRDLWHQKTRVPGLSCGIICVILRLAILIQQAYRSVTDTHTHTHTHTDRQTDRHTRTAYTALAQRRTVKIYSGWCCHFREASCSFDEIFRTFISFSFT